MTFQSISKRNILFVTFFAFCNFPKNMGQKPVISLLNQATWASAAGEVNQLQLTASSVVFNPKKDFQSDKYKTQCNICLKKSLNCSHSYFFYPGYTTEHSTNIQCYFFLIKQAALWLKAPLVVDHCTHTQATAYYFCMTKEVMRCWEYCQHVM